MPERQTSSSAEPAEPLHSLNSLNSVTESDQTSSDQLEAQVLATSATRSLLVISWEDVKTAAILDEPYADLLNALHSDTEIWNDSLAEYKKYKKDMTKVDGVVLYKGRVVVTQVLCPQTLQALLLAHQGETGMVLRTHEAVWWPNITSDITETRARCSTCHKNAPTQLPIPPVHPSLPQYPFQMISSVYFYYEGQNYLLFVDRYSNWPVIKKCKSESAEELVTALREFFSTYGVTEQITLDGAPHTSLIPHNNF